MHARLILSLALLPLVSGGCVAKAAFDVVTMPVKAGAQVADWSTTSQDESDRNYGRKMREKEAAEGKKQRDEDRKRDRDRDDRDD